MRVFNLVTWNMRGGILDVMKQYYIAEVMVSSNIDIILLQETGHKSDGVIYNTLELWNLCIATINGINTNNSHITYFRSNLASNLYV